MRRHLLLLVLLFALPGLQARDRESPLVGTWLINQERTAEVQPEFKNAGMFDNLGGGSVSVSVMGVPLPKSQRPQRNAIGAPRDPDVLACLEMVLQEDGDRMQATYQNVGEEMFIRGNFRGRSTNWRGKSLTQSYETTERKVTKTYQIQADGSLLVTVKIKPQKDKKRIYKRVFERATAPATPNPATPAQESRAAS
ncbi:MAG: hypothetical protein H6994_17360 [Pseudomonadales bacterium]|nr:hypothetical protein [Pseudomonadales bacterium]